MEIAHFESLYPADTRFETINKLLTSVKAGHSPQLLSLPGVGRGTTLGLLTYNRTVREKHLGKDADLYHFVPINFAEVKNKNFLDVTKFMLLAVIDSLKARGRKTEAEQVTSFFTASSSQDELIVFHALKNSTDYLSNEKKLIVVFLFERFEELIPTITSDFFTNFRALRNLAKFHFSVVFSLTRPLEDVLDPTIFTEYFEFIAGQTIYLPFMDTPGLNFRISHLEKVTGKKLIEKQKQEILALTGGHLKLTRIAAELVFQHGTTADLEHFLLYQKPIQGTLFEIWHSLLPEEQKHIIKMHTDTPPNDTHEYLELSGLLTKNNIQIPLFWEFTKSFSTDSIRDKIVFDKSANEIKKGTQNLSNTLTSAEFHLLRYLLEHPETIVSRDQIIQAVWQSNKTTEGVTEQALDQLILRLRKKIEEDPTTPYHLQTVKGRGFRFTP